MTILWILLIGTLIGISLLLFVAGRRIQQKTFPRYEEFLQVTDPRVRKSTFRFSRKVVVSRDLILRGIQKWIIALFHLFLELIHFVSAKFNKGLVRMKYTTRKKVREINTQEPSDFLRKMKEDREKRAGEQEEKR